MLLSGNGISARYFVRFYDYGRECGFVFVKTPRFETAMGFGVSDGLFEVSTDGRLCASVFGGCGRWLV